MVRLHHHWPCLAACRVLSVQIVQVSGRGGRKGQGRPLYRRVRGTCSQQGLQCYSYHQLSARGLRSAFFLWSLETLNQAQNLPQNPTVEHHQCAPDVPEWNVNDTYASKLKICTYMHNMHQDAEIYISNMQEYAVPNMQKICTICKNEIHCTAGREMGLRQTNR